jgi:3-phosphoshikimate 1-carboxyvinyltransferase
MPDGVRVEPAASVQGAIAVPGDKSLSHRAVLVGALGDGETRVRGFGRSEDTLATVEAVRALGIEVEDGGADELLVHGAGLRGLRSANVDCGNAGTLLRLVTGVLAGQAGRFELMGDESLSARPMERVAEPLRMMGARVETTDGHAPVVVEGTRSLRGISYELPVASAQIKSAILLAGLNAGGPTTVLEPRPTRDHTERMLTAAGARVSRRGKAVTIHPARTLRLGDVTIPGDFSSAAPFVVAATLLSGSRLIVRGVSVNPTRTGLLDVLERMGARIGVFERRTTGGEPVADLEVESAPLTAAEIGPDEVPGMVDELPLFALAASMAHGESTVAGAAELRVKETDRIAAVAGGLHRLGAHIRAREDGWTITGVPARLRGGTMDSMGDHRIAMLGALAGLVSREGVTIENARSVAVSFPGFFGLLDSVSQR